VNARLFEELRPVGFAVAYRMLGSVSEAEDIVQEAFLRLHHTLQDGKRIESPRAYLSTVVTRLCINHLRSARARRETYLEALPEPLVGEPGAAVPLAGERTGRVPDAGGDPASHAEMADSLSLAFLVLLETLSPEQRAAFLLREVFDYPYDQIAAIVATSQQNARQLVARARRHVEQRRPRFEPSREQRERLARRFFAAAQDGDPGALEELLAHDVTLHGGGLPQPLKGRVRVARTLLAGFADRHDPPRRHLAARGHSERATRGDGARPVRAADRRGSARHRRGRPDPDGDLGGQPGQAAAPGPAGRGGAERGPAGPPA
jgi:RNA polymerase sigma factor (sigma-70 family)